MYWVMGVIGAVAIAGVLAGQAGMLNGAPPGDLGVRDGRLKPPSSTENSVSSQASLDPNHPQRRYAEIAPIASQSGGPATIERIVKVVEAMPGSKIIDNRSDYVYAQFTTRALKFVDDVEFWYDPNAQTVQVRSASRVGQKDLGVNRKRIEAIRNALLAS